LIFGGDDEVEVAGITSTNSFVSRLLPSYEGSMRTAGVTFYF
jgi:hypothetical protein